MSFHETQTTPPNPAIDEHRWVFQIQQQLEDDHEEETGISVSIFNVSKTLIATKPEAYIPQQVALGPYHHRRAELYEMERYKLSAAKRTQKQLKTLKLQNLVHCFLKSEQQIRSSYHRYLDVNGETLAWMMAVDASFLLEFLQMFAAKYGKVLAKISSRMSHLVDYSARRSAHNVILRDIIMLENQIPLFLLKKILDSKCSSTEEADEELSAILRGLCKELSPFKTIKNFPKIQITDHAHLLDLLYHVLVAESKQSKETGEFIDQDVKIEVTTEESSFGNGGQIKKLLKTTWDFIKRVLLSRPIKIIAKIPWMILTKLPIFSLLKQPVEYFFFSQEKEDIKPEDGNPSSNINCPPSIEEITIPSVSDLTRVGVRFMATNGDISTISFNEKTVTFSLPTVTLDVNAEVILRNLVAFEVSSASGLLVFTRYTELMNGIIDTEEDVKLLRNMGIIKNCLKTDGEAAIVWNGMSKSVRLTKVPFIDKVIEDVNKYYSSRWKVKVGKFMKRYVFGSWQFLTFLAVILLLLLTCFQAFCSVYKCA